MDLQKRRADLVAQVEQYVGQINRNNGAIALIDDLLRERQAEAAQEPTTTEAAMFGGIDREPSPMWQNAPSIVEPPSADPDWVQPEVKAMQSSQSEDVA